MDRINVLLINPASYEDRFDQKLSPYKFFPFSILYPLNFVKKKNICEIDYYDIVIDGKDNLLDLIRKQNFDLIGFTSSPEVRFYTIDLIRDIKCISPNSKIVVGGYFFSQTGSEALENVPEIDYIVIGEGEITLYELVMYLNGQLSDLSEVDGLCYRDNGNIIKNKSRKPSKSIDEFVIDYDLIYKPDYDYLFPLKNWEAHEDIRAFPIMFGRGCNNKCIFCMHRHLPYRVISFDKAVEQIKFAINKFDTKYFIFTDPSFTERTSFVIKLCNYLIENKIDIKWYCEARADTPPKLLRLMARAGCISVDFALESGSDKVLRKLKKKIDVGKIKEFAKICKKCGIRASYFTMISMPDETIDDVNKTMNVIKKLLKYDMSTSIAPLLIFPKTELEQLAIERGVIPEDFSWYDRSFKCEYKFMTPREEIMPHYIEGLSESQICDCLQMHGEILSSYFTKKQVGPLWKHRFLNFSLWKHRYLYTVNYINGNRLFRKINRLPRPSDIRKLYDLMVGFFRGIKHIK
ncbi:MAG: B12-binding domain-containing radical SAM protein [Desulfobacula sp.]|nr:B12-binding domain-containing radical SAM protein [Desulfobacula sp.]